MNEERALILCNVDEFNDAQNLTNDDLVAETAIKYEIVDKSNTRFKFCSHSKPDHVCVQSGLSEYAASALSHQLSIYFVVQYC